MAQTYFPNPRRTISETVKETETVDSLAHGAEVQSAYIQHRDRCVHLLLALSTR